MDPFVYLTGDRFPMIRDIGWNQVDEVYTHHDRLLDFDIFVFVTKGSMQVVEETVEYIIHEKEHLFLKKGLHHWGRPETLPGTSWYWIHFNSPVDDYSSYKDQSPLPEIDFFYPDHYAYRFPLPKHGTSPFHRTLENRLHLLVEDFGKPKEHGMVQLSIQVYQMFLELHKATKEHSQSTKNSGKGEAVAGRVMAFLKQHIDEDFDSTQLSSHLNLNYSYVSATFKTQTGLSIIEAHTKLRINKAIDWMRNTSLNVSEISERLGYRNPYYFSRVFKKVIGESPSSYMSNFYKNKSMKILLNR
ncbi:helix-turn-helix transcriptional regulator [Paenibacillus sp. MAH-36]|uniref:AraC family transcriptional regulator n=1 Tax=Paenibacillus violae TaxID=3077234 RepID=A0ABU3RDY5_9BACL|nr:AraC family transcriptional regulator [Paenibacillus sp. PFR10]MDU0202032.1 AraC family transcriptional regulator [Paenibacillus sp. PFR10]